MENRNEDILGTQDKSGEVGTPAGAGKAWFKEGQRSAERAKPGTLLHDKSHWEARVEAALLDIMKIICSELSKHVLNGEKVKAFPTKTGNRTRVNTLSTPVHHSDKSLSKSSNVGEAGRSNSNRGEVKCPCLQMTQAVVRSWWLY